MPVLVFSIGESDSRAFNGVTLGDGGAVNISTNSEVPKSSMPDANNHRETTCGSVAASRQASANAAWHNFKKFHPSLIFRIRTRPNYQNYLINFYNGQSELYTWTNTAMGTVGLTKLPGAECQ